MIAGADDAEPQQECPFQEKNPPFGSKPEQVLHQNDAVRGKGRAEIEISATVIS